MAKKNPKVITLTVLPPPEDRSKEVMLELLDEIRQRVESGECQGFVLVESRHGRLINENDTVVVEPFTGNLMLCEAICLLDQGRWILHEMMGVE